MNEIDRKIDVTAILFLLVQKRQQTHDWTLIGSGANGIGIQVWYGFVPYSKNCGSFEISLQSLYGLNIENVF